MSLPILYSFRRCPYAMRARLALWASQQLCELREVKLSAKPDHMLAISPKATVPVLQLNSGQVIEESLDIMRWALASHDPMAWLNGDDPALIAENDGPFKYNLDRYKYPERHGSDAVAHRDAAHDFLRQIDARLSGGGQLGGTKMGLADAAIMPFVRQFAAVDRDYFAQMELPALHRWLEQHLSSELFQAIMTRWKPWQDGDEIILFGQDQAGLGAGEA